MRLLKPVGLLLGLWPVAAPAAEIVMEPVEVSLPAGELRNVEVDLGPALAPGQPYRAELEKVARATFLRIGFAGPGVPFTQAPQAADLAPGEPLRLRVLAERCCQEGPAEREILVQPAGAQGAALPVRVPLRVHVTASSGPLDCQGRGRRAVSRAAIAGLFSLYLFGLITNSHFLSRKQLALRLRPLRWDATGRPVEHSLADVERLVRRDLSFWKRTRAWLAANPLVFGSPGGSYHETVELHLQPRLDVFASRLVLVGKRDLARGLQRRPEQRTGLFATALDGLRFFAVTVRGRIGALSLESPGPASGEPVFSWIHGSRELRYQPQTGGGQATEGAAGWRI